MIGIKFDFFQTVNNVEFEVFEKTQYIIYNIQYIYIVLVNNFCEY